MKEYVYIHYLWRPLPAVFVCGAEDILEADALLLKATGLKADKEPFIGAHRIGSPGWNEDRYFSDRKG